MKFKDFDLDKNLVRGIEDAGYAECMPVQEATLKHSLSGRDVVVQSQTGTGKTAAYLATIFQNLERDKKRQAIIIAPTRELAAQIDAEARTLGRHMGFKTGCFFGGVGYAPQEKRIKDGIDIIVGTPGRLIDLNQSRRLGFDRISMLVIDEADRMFDMGFWPDIRRMIKKMPPYSKRQSMLFSATLNYRARELAWQYMNNPFEIEISPEKVTVDNIQQEVYHVGNEEKMSLLLGILKKEAPNNALIFTNTKRFAMEVARRLEVNGYSCRYIIGEMPQKKRIEVIEDMKSGRVPILVATNVASRGLHIEDLDLVINYDLPEDSEDYIHRIGRTARAGKSGKAISLACERYCYSLEGIESLMDMKIPVMWADDSFLEKDQSRGKRYSFTMDSRKRPEKSRASTKPHTKGHPKVRREAHKKNAKQQRLEYYAKKYGDKFK
ncbi:MAG: DEAD/DEAH box helicase [Thermodesulfobacteriota bacterium]|nr:DEAD/DEAH box helicase [Thermodesulfobacteriota bacterium]